MANMNAGTNICLKVLISLTIFLSKDMVGFDPKLKVHLSKSDQVLAGAVSGVVTRGICQPLDVLKIRFQLQVEPIRKHQGKYHGIFQCMRHILKEEGVRALWKGHMPAQLLSVVFGGVQFVTFEILTKQVWLYLPESLTMDYRPLTHFGCGGMAGCFATVACQPFDVLRTRFVAQGEPKVYRSMHEAYSLMVKQEGMLSFYKGLTPTLLQIAPSTAFQFGFYTMFLQLWKFVRQSDPSVISVTDSLMCGSAAGLCAKVVIYPLDLLKKRLQIQGFAHGRKQFGRTSKYRGLFHCLCTVFREEGRGALYKGLSPSMLKAVVSAALHFSVYEQCCHLLTKKDS